MVLHFADWIVIAVYAIALTAIVVLVSRRAESAESYFLAGRSLRWPFIGASLFAANISAEHFVGLAGAGYAGGMAVGGFEWMAIYCLVPLIALFLPFYVSRGIYTVPEFLEQRFSPFIRLFFSGYMVVLSVLAKISISLWASAVVFRDLMGWNPLVVIWSVGLITALYTMKGGLRAVVYTDALQTTILIVAAAVLLTFGIARVGGLEELAARAPAQAFEMIKPATHPDYPWPGMFFAVFILGSFYWSMDQVLVQRVFAARSINEGRLGAIFCGFLKLTTPFLLVMPGVVARVLHPDLQTPDAAFPTLLRTLLPVGMVGLVVAGIAAALMGHISATYNSIATLVTRDFYLRFRPDAPQERQITVARLTIAAVFVLGALWAPLIEKFGSIWTYLQSVQAYMMMPFAGIFFLGLLSRRTTTKGVVACVICACVACPVLMTNNLLIRDGHDFLPFMRHPLLLPWLHSASVGFILCMVVLLLVSMFTRREPPEKLAATTVTDLRGTVLAEIETGWRDYRRWLGLLLVTVSVVWFLMR